MYRYLFYFLIYSFLGWCVEVCYATLNTKKFINRGFLNGPYCPIYGVGVMTYSFHSFCGIDFYTRIFNRIYS